MDSNTLAHRYEVLRPLGEGGFGQTSVARDLETGELVALKRLQMRRAADWKSIELFEREARVLRHLEHPSIPQYLDWFEDEEGSYCLVQELAPGQTLAERVESGWHPTDDEVRDLAVALLEVMSYLHERNPPVIHRDIKPHNVLLADDGKVSLVDFGSVKDVHNESSRGSTVIGSFGYMAPEQFRGRAVPPTDLYGLGSTLLYVLTHQDPSEMPTRRLKIDVRAVLPNQSEAFLEWLEVVLEPDDQDRFASARLAQDALLSPHKSSPAGPSSVEEPPDAETGSLVTPRHRLSPAQVHEVSQAHSIPLAALGLLGSAAIGCGVMLNYGGEFNGVWVFGLFLTLLMVLLGVSPSTTDQGVVRSVLRDHAGFVKTGLVGTLVSIAIMLSSTGALTLFLGGASMLLWMLIFFVFLGHWRGLKSQHEFEQATDLELPLISSEPTVDVRVLSYERGRSLSLRSRNRLGPHSLWMFGGFWVFGAALLSLFSPGAAPLLASASSMGALALTAVGLLVSLRHHMRRSVLEITRGQQLRSKRNGFELVIETRDIVSCKVEISGEGEGLDTHAVDVLVRHRESSGTVVESLVYRASEDARVMAVGLAHQLESMMRDVLGAGAGGEREDVIFDWSEVAGVEEVSLSFTLQVVEETSTW